LKFATYSDTIYCVIKSFAHKGLRKFYETGSTAGINPQWALRLKPRLTALDNATSLDDLNVQGYRLHQHQGEGVGTWSIDLTGNWRLLFRFEDGDVYVLDIKDPH
jgi:proteic killer suppression protein